MTRLKDFEIVPKTIKWKEKLEDLAFEMKALGSDMQYYGGFNETIVAKGKELEEAGELALQWLNEDWSQK